MSGRDDAAAQATDRRYAADFGAMAAMRTRIPCVGLLPSDYPTCCNGLSFLPPLLRSLRRGVFTSWEQYPYPV